MTEEYSQSLKNCLDTSINEYIKEKVFTGASIGIVCCSHGEFKRVTLCYGKTGDSEKAIDFNTFYDLASLTKPLVTVFSILALIKNRKIKWNENLESLLSQSIPIDKKNITLIHLLSHCSGLPAHKQYDEILSNIPPDQRKKEIIDRILHEDLICRPGEQNIYSDLGYILLGKSIEKKSGMKLDEFWKEKIIDPLGLGEKMFFPKKEQRDKNSFASTGYCPELKRNLYGIVHDDNCRFIGGIAGHAGLFGTIEGVLLFCENILKGYDNIFTHPSYNNDDLRKALKMQDNSPWTLGFDTPLPGASSSGRYFSPASVGHLGFTGTSFWIDLQRKIGIVLLSNRTFYGAKNEKLKKVRPIVHDLLMKEILKYILE
ncbi:MAG: serine hydrolase [Desulfocapsaceae bacterium]|nr:serine hydrolase [Desulfocapsaceae bacterium]